MQQRQLRLGDILDDYCPRERRVTNHAVVAMIGEDVKQTRCTTCDADHEYKHAKVPRQRRKTETPAALYSQVLANGPKRVAHDERGGQRIGPRARTSRRTWTTSVEEPPDDATAGRAPRTSTSQRPPLRGRTTPATTAAAADAEDDEDDRRESRRGEGRCIGR